MCLKFTFNVASSRFIRNNSVTICLSTVSSFRKPKLKRFESAFHSLPRNILFPWGNVLKVHLHSLHANYFHFTALPMCTTNCSHFLDCESRHGYYYCNCQPGFSGPHCNMNIDECSSSPCVNGKCVDGVNRYDCICNKGYWGTNCDKEVKRESKGGNKCWIFLKVKHSKSESLLYWSLAVTKFVSSFKESGKEVVTLLLKRL